MRNVLVIVFTVALAKHLFSQVPLYQQTLFTVGGDKVTVGEFEYVYNKNNVNIQSDYSEKSLRDYLELYENFRLKVKEAEVLRLDTIKALKDELETYRKRLAISYLTDKLVQEAYDRSKIDLNVSHIIISCNENANPVDTVIAYKRITALRKKIENGVSFEKLARDSSEDKSAQTNEGNIGWFTVFGTIYPFENTAYALKPGEISQPVRTQFGYHIVRVNEKRPARGTIRVAHILFRFPENATQSEKESTGRIAQDVWARLNSGTLSFDSAAARYSGDKATRSNGGELQQWVGASLQQKYPKTFEDAAYALTSDGSFSKPVATEYGYHIIRRIEVRTTPSFEDAKTDLRKRVEKDSRLQVAKLKESQLEQNSPEFNTLVKEYRDGILLFELMDRMIWTKAAKDSEGLEQYRKKYLPQKTLSVDKDAIVSGYQQSLEEKFLDELRKKYPIVLNEPALNSLINKPYENDPYAKSLSDIYETLGNNSESKAEKPPVLTVTNTKFSDANGNNRIDGNEECSICFSVTNSGKGTARDVKAVIRDENGVKGISFDNPNIGDISPGSSQNVCVNIKSNIGLVSGMAKFKVSFEENAGFAPEPLEISVETKEFSKPNVVVADYSFLSDNGSIKPGLPIQLKALIQNIGQGKSDKTAVKFIYPDKNVLPNSETDFNIGDLNAGEQREIVFEFIVNRLYTDKEIPIKIKCIEKLGIFAETKMVFTSLDSKSSGVTIAVKANDEDLSANVKIERASLSSDVDKNIPLSPTKKTNAYALIIGNEDYTRYQSGLSSEANVEFAKNDANMFAQYAERTIGIPSDNIVLLIDALSSKMRAEIERVVKMAQLSKGEIYFYYAGHGLPDEASKEAYIMPVDISGSDIQSAIKLNELYKKLCSPGIQKATVFLDACFSGGGRLEGLVAARSVKIAPKADALPSNILVFAASSGAQVSLPYKEKQHGMFTYYFLKKLQDSKGETTMKDLADYVKQNVPLQSLKVNRKEQSPNVLVGNGFTSTWESMSFQK